MTARGFALTVAAVIVVLLVLGWLFGSGGWIRFAAAAAVAVVGGRWIIDEQRWNP